MYLFLNPNPRFDRALYKKLRIKARETIENMNIIQGSYNGNREMFRAMLVGFWYYVKRFQVAIDIRSRKMMPIKPLMSLYGKDKIIEFITLANKAVEEMKNEEGDHAEMWKDDAIRLKFDLEDVPFFPGVNRLLQCAYVNDSVAFFCQLAATEFIAEELTKYLYSSSKFLNTFFPDGIWKWGDAHLEYDGVSHLDIDLDLARSFYLVTMEQPDITEENLLAADITISNIILDRFSIFEEAAEEVALSKCYFRDLKPLVV